MAKLKHLLDPSVNGNGHREPTDEDEFLDQIETELRTAARYANAVSALVELTEITESFEVTPLLRQWARPHLVAVGKLVEDRRKALGRTAPPAPPALSKA